MRPLSGRAAAQQRGGQIGRARQGQDAQHGAGKGPRCAAAYVSASPRSTLRAGAKLGNLGGYLDGADYSLPTDFTAGAALDTFFSDAHELTVGADLGYSFAPEAVRGFRMSLGAEYNLMQLFQFRAGYHYGERRYYDPSYWSLGAGVRFLHLRLDFAYLFAKSDTLLHNSCAVSFGFDF